MVAYIRSMKYMFWASDNVRASIAADLALEAAVDLYWANRHV